MKLFILILLISQSALAGNGDYNCRKWVMTQKILGSMTDMVDSGDTNCAERALVWREEADSTPAFVKCEDKGNTRDSYNACYYSKELIDGIMEDVDVLSYKKICQKFRPQLEYAYQGCRKKIR
jgi:hypothetical protein